MSDIQVPVTVPKEFYDVLGALVDLGLAAKAGNINLVTEAAALVSLIGEFSALPAEVMGEPTACIAAGVLQVVRLVEGLLAPAPVPTPTPAAA